jgi:hypothetical protein
MGVCGQSHASASIPLGKRIGIHCTGGRVGVGNFWTGTENLTPTGVRTVDRTAYSESAS